MLSPQRRKQISWLAPKQWRRKRRKNTQQRARGSLPLVLVGLMTATRCALRVSFYFRRLLTSLDRTRVRMRSTTRTCSVCPGKPLARSGTVRVVALRSTVSVSRLAGDRVGEGVAVPGRRSKRILFAYPRERKRTASPSQLCAGRSLLCAVLVFLLFAP